MNATKDVPDILDRIIAAAGKKGKPSQGLDLDAVAAATTAGLETVAPERRTQTIALRLLALLVRQRAKGFEHLTQADVAKTLGVTQSAVSRAGDRAEEALAVHTRGDRKGE